MRFLKLLLRSAKVTKTEPTLLSVLSFFLSFFTVNFVLLFYSNMAIIFESIKSGQWFSLSSLDAIVMHQQVQHIYVSVNAKTIFNEILYAGDDGNIYIEDFNSLLLPYFVFTDSGVEPLEVEIDCDYGTVEFSAFYSDNFSKFEFSQYFDGESPLLSFSKTILPVQKVSIPFYATDDIQIKFYVETVFGAFSFDYALREVRLEGFYNCEWDLDFIASELNENNVSPLQHILPEHILSISVVDEAEHYYKFIADHSNYSLAAQFAFINKLGFIEYLAVPGTLIRKLQLEREIEQKGNNLILSANNYDASFEIKSAILTDDQQQSLRDLFLSPKVWLYHNNQLIDAIIDSINDEQYDSDDALYAAEFSFRLSNTKIYNL